MQNLSQKVVIITGASSGIGEALAFEAASRGASLMLAARNIKKLEALAHILEKDSVRVKICQTDVAVMSDCEHLINETIQAYGKIDVLINNAGISMRALFVDTDPAVLQRLMDVNFCSLLYKIRFTPSAQAKR